MEIKNFAQQYLPREVEVGYFEVYVQKCIQITT